MVDKNQIKNQGLVLGRSLLTALRIASMYSVDHSAAERAVQQSYSSLNSLLKQLGRFTLGFLNQRLLLGNILTSDKSLTQLEVEFSKRGIAAVDFEAGISLREFKRGLTVLCAQPRVIEENGGIRPFLEKNPLVAMQVIPASKPEDEDTVLEMDTASSLIAQGLLGAQAQVAGQATDALFQSAGLEKAPKTTKSADEVLQQAGEATLSILADSDHDPSESVGTLARLIEELTPDYLFSSLTPAKRSALAGLSTKEMATDLIEDISLQSSVKRLADSPTGPAGTAVEEEVLQILARSLKATRMAERFLQKLSRFVEEAQLPVEVSKRLREEVVWFSLSEEDKHAKLLGLERYNPQEFRRLVHYVRDRMREGKTDAALEVTKHYFARLGKRPLNMSVEDLARAPELVQAVTGLPALPFLQNLAERLGQELSDMGSDGKAFHQQAANCLACVALSSASYEDFELVQQIEEYLQASLAADSTQHADCCGQALKGLLSPSNAERLIELYMAEEGDPSRVRAKVNLLKLTGTLGSEKAFERLEEEDTACNRLRLMRLIEQLGSAAIEPARKRLADERWYVVRNACYLLGDLGDPDLSIQLRKAICHPDARVQQAAVMAMIKSRASDRATVLAQAMPNLQGQIQEMVLDELGFLKDPASIESLEQFILSKNGGKTGVLEKAVQALGVIPSERAVEALRKVLYDKAQVLSVRKTALVCLSRNPLSLAGRVLADFSRQAEGDPLAREAQRLLGPSKEHQ